MSPWSWGVLILAVLLVLRLLLELKTSRPDGALIRKLHPYRRLMGIIMPRRDEAVVYYDTYVRAEELLRYLEQARRSFDADVTHCLVAAGGHALREVPQMNRFVIGSRLYQRRSCWVTFSMKRKKLDGKAKIAVLKLELPPEESFRGLCERINGKIGIERAERRTTAEREYDLLHLLPRPLLRAGFWLLRWLDDVNLLPARFIRHDAMYTGMVIANLGSVGMGAGFHHLYEWGSCPLFLMAGKIEDRPVVEEGKLEVRKILHLRWSYDERIDDGLTSSYGIAAVVDVLEHPFQRLGGLEEAARVGRGEMLPGTGSAAIP